ncbi:hypothetical protein C6341_g3543 [Phytophthora cactorum]|nr:hypothetical protein C6341_g3543 [Phytophthora cactorum]
MAAEIKALPTNPRSDDNQQSSFPGNIGLLLGSVPLFGVVAYQPAQARKTIERSWHWRHFILSDHSDDEEFHKTLRVPGRAFWKQLNIIEPDLIRKRTNWCVSLSPAIRLRVYLYYAGHDSSMQQLSVLFGIGRSTASGIIKSVSESITSRMENWIAFPETRAELLKLSTAFEESRRLPGCVAAIDGCHIPITQPAVPKSHKFYKRKGFYSLNMSTAVDNRRRFLCVDICWPGSVGDNRVFNNSALGRRHQSLLRGASSEDGDGTMQVGWYLCEHVPFHLLVDSAYANSRFVVTIYEIAEAQQDIVVARLNQKLAGMRYTVECAFGILKGRWRLLQRPIEMARTNLKAVPTLVCSLCILYNFLIEYGDQVWDVEDERKRKAYYDANYLAISSNGCMITV